MLKFFSGIRAAAFMVLSVTVAGVAMASSAGGGACAPKEPWKEWHASPGVGSPAALQRGARNFMNYCSGCHSLQFMRYSRMAADLNLTEEQMKQDLMFTGGGINDTVKTSMPAKEAEEWFGRTPPDLSLIARSRGTDYLYQFLKGFYVDEARPTGANNLVLKDTAMPFVLADLAGQQKAVFTLEKCVENGEEKMVRSFDRFENTAPGALGEAEYDQFVRDTVSFLQYVGEPVQAKREKLGLWVILFLAVFTLFAWMLKKEIWKDVH